MEENEYTAEGYESRRHYLECMAEDYGVPMSTVIHLANMLGRNEDFDGLLAALESASE